MMNEARNDSERQAIRDYINRMWYKKGGRNAVLSLLTTLSLFDIGELRVGCPPQTFVHATDSPLKKEPHFCGSFIIPHVIPQKPPQSPKLHKIRSPKLTITTIDYIGKRW